MEYRTLGSSGIKVSAFSLGSWNTFEFMSEAEGLEVMQAAIDNGINFLDDARYDDTSGKAPLKTGYSEVVFGNLLRAGGFDREKLTISNRLWFEFYPEQSFEDEVDASLERIGMDYFDLVFCFTPPENLAPEAMVEQLASLVESGKVRYWAPGNWPVELLAQCCDIASRTGAPLPPAAMVPYSVSLRSFVDNDTMPALCRDYDISLVASFCLHGGILTGKYSRPDSQPTRRFSAEQLAKMKETQLLERAAKYVEIAEEAGFAPATLAYAYCLRNPNVGSILFGATSAEQIRENLRALDAVARIDDELIESLHALFPADGSFQG
jgi:aryl-alcohol dehydrogenase-like predicted oxidoreductase